MQSKAIKSLCRISEKTHFLENWTINIKRDAECKKRCSTLSNLFDSKVFINRNKQSMVKFKQPNRCPANLSTHVVFLEKPMQVSQKAKSKQRSHMPLIKRKLLQKKLLESYLYKKSTQFGKNDSTCNTINLYESMKVSSLERLPIQSSPQQCTFSNTKLMESLRKKGNGIQADRKEAKPTKASQWQSRYFQQSFVREETHCSSGPFDSRRRVDEKRDVLCHSRKSFLVNRRSKKSKSLDIL